MITRLGCIKSGNVKMIDFGKFSTAIGNPIVSSESKKDSQSVLDIDQPGVKHVIEDEYVVIRFSMSETSVFKMSQKSPGGGGASGGGEIGGKGGI